MGKLSTLKPRLQALGSRLSSQPAQTRQEAEQVRLRDRDVNVGWRKWYKTARWQKLRMQVLVRDLFTCQMKDCGKIEHNTSQLVADHKIQHHGDEALFWDERNIQCLCKTCHDSLKQKEERARPGW